MEVILKEDVPKLGSRGDVVRVAEGYGRNFLLPRKLALLVTDGNKKQIERERARFDAREAEEKGMAGTVAERIAGVALDIARRVGETEVLYGSVTSADIAEGLHAKGFDIDRRKIQLPEPIKKLGEYDVPIRLHREVTTTVKVRVVPEARLAVELVNTSLVAVPATTVSTPELSVRVPSTAWIWAEPTT
jgi:large subunit ribosomal protein L9